MKKVKIKINKKNKEALSGKRVLDFCLEEGLEIAHLCHHKNLDFCSIKERDYSGKSVCRLCLVKVKFKEEKGFKLLPSCELKIEEGMEIITEDEEIINLRKINLELLFASHAGLCAFCKKNKDCELQDLAFKYDIDEFRFVPRLMDLKEGEELELLYEKMSHRKIDDKNTSIVRDSAKCIKCRRCEKICKNIQSVGAYCTSGKSYETSVSTEYNLPLECTYCGQCTTVCPTSAIMEKDFIGDFLKAEKNSKKKIIVQIAPSIRVSLGEEFGMIPGTIITGKMINALKQCGADLVFDTNFGADLTIMEEATELVERIKTRKKPLPMFTSCCPAWVLFMEQNYPEFLSHLSSCRSPHMMVGPLIKYYYGRKIKIDPENIFNVSIMPCTAKKYEINRPEFKHGRIKDVDCVLTTRELGRLIRLKQIDFLNLEDASFDPALGLATGAGAIFGATGGVAEAALRTAHYFITGKNARKIEFQEVRGINGVRNAIIQIRGLKLRVKVVNGLANAKKVMDDFKNGKVDFDFLEVMACPGGCIGGGGQPIPTSPEIREKRRMAIYSQDKTMKLRQSHENPLIVELYQRFLIAPGSRKSEKYLHTHYYSYQWIWR